MEQDVRGERALKAERCEEPIALGELTEEILLCLQDEFEASVNAEDNVLTMRFGNGQTFSVTVAKQ